MKIIATGLLLALLVAGCRYTCVEATGPVEDRRMEIAPFQAVAVSGASTVTLEKGDVQQVVVSAQADVIDLLKTEVSGGVWDISTKQCWNSDHGIRVRIITPTPITSIQVTGSAEVDAGNVFSVERAKLTTSGSGSIRVAEVNAKELDLGISGSGSITVRGTCTEMDGQLSGSGNLQAADLAANAVRLAVSGSGNATVKAISSLDADVSCSGEVRYSGKPQVKSTISGSGSVTPLP